MKNPSSTTPPSTPSQKQAKLLRALKALKKLSPEKRADLIQAEARSRGLLRD